MQKDFLTDLVGEEAAEVIWQAHQDALEQNRRVLEGDLAIREAIFLGGGRNETAIRALLDREAICGCDDPKAAAKEAVSKIRREAGYLFRQPQAYAPAQPAPVSREDVAGMSMAEYRRWRKG